VLANSGVEPFGLVGLETMAVGGVAFVGCTGEDYVIPGYDAISLQSSDPQEIVHHVIRLKRCMEAAARLRRLARLSAERYTWPEVIRRVFLPVLEQFRVDFTETDSPRWEALEADLETELLVPASETVARAGAEAVLWGRGK